MTIALAGYSGFIASHLRKSFPGHEYILLDRADLYGRIELLARKIESADVVINLAGYSISKRWTPYTKEKIRKSRIDLTNNLVGAINSLKNKPGCFVSASAIGIYEYDTQHNEQEFCYGNNFLADVVKSWEAAAEGVSNDVRLIKVRLGMVLGRDGGAFPLMVRLFRYGLGSVLGSGTQVYSFIHIDDVIGAIMYLIKNGGKGNYNLTAPNPVSNRDFTKTIAKIMSKPIFLTLPEFLLRLVLGTASVIVLKGQTVYPKRLLDEGYKFTFASVDNAIENLLSSK